MEQSQIEKSIRLKKLIKALNLNQSAFAKSLEMTQPNINRMISGRNNISIELLNRITDKYKRVNLHWLLTGDGEMFFGEVKNISSQENDIHTVKGKGRLEELEERLDRLEEVVKRLAKGFEK